MLISEGYTTIVKKVYSDTKVKVIPMARVSSINWDLFGKIATRCTGYAMLIWEYIPVYRLSIKLSAFSITRLKICGKYCSIIVDIRLLVTYVYFLF